MSKPALRLGSAWYPELWDEATTLIDLALMQKLGFNAARVGDFAWAHLEPAEGRFETAWLGRALDLAHAHGIGVVLCTPTAGPPAWLLHAHPELGWVERDGYRHGVGGRQAGDYAHPLFQQYSRRITEVMARAFGRHPAVIGWQTDNEFAGHQKVSLSAAALSGWHVWLAKHYGTIENLNACWGTDVWSNTYASFDEVPGPHPLPTYCHNHSLHTAYRRYMLDTVLVFQRQQVDLIRAHSAAPISHNSEDSLDEWDLSRDLDVAGIDYYTNRATLDQMVYRLDCQRALKPGRRFWLLETNSEGELTDGPLPAGWLENVAMLAYTAGAESISYWPWRTNRSGAEICGHDGVIHSCGVPNAAWEPARRTAALRRQLEPLLADFSPAPAPVAMMRAERNGNAYYIERIAGLKPGFDLRAHLEVHHLDLIRLGMWRDVLYDQAEVTGYRLVITPYLPYTTPEFLARMRAHLASGGTWVVGPYTGYLTVHHTNPLNGLLGDLGEMLDLDVVAWAPIKDLPVTLHDGSQARAQMRTHAFAPAAGDEVLGVLGGDRIAGLAWGLCRKVGAGTIYVLGSELDTEARRRIYSTICARAGITCYPLPDQVVRTPQVDAQGRTAWALVNSGRTAVTVTLPGPGRDLLSGALVETSLVMPASSNAFVLFTASFPG